MPAKECHYAVCRAVPTILDLFCDRHWRMVESDTRRVIERTYRPGKKASAAFLNAITLATREILFYTTHGHHAPVALQFDLDDDGKAIAHD